MSVSGVVRLPNNIVMSEKPSRKAIIKLMLLVSLPLYIIDQLSKWWIVFNFKLPRIFEVNGVTYGYEDTRIMIEGFFNLVRRHNQGAAFGIGNGTSWAPVVFLCVLVIALLAILFFWKRGSFTGPARWSAPLLIAGILGNLTDRLFQGFWLLEFQDAGFWIRLSKGYVVDFLDFTIPIVDYRWPAFNVADSCITISAILLFITALMEGRQDFMNSKSSNTTPQNSRDD